MKRRILAAILTVCLCLTFLPAAALAREPDEHTEWKEADTIIVASVAELAAALPDGEEEPDENNIVWIPVAQLGADLTMEDGDTVHTLGKLIVPAGMTMTIEAGAELEAEVENHGTVIVHAGGALMTTMAGEDAITNYGTIRVDHGATLTSQMGGVVCNRAGGTLEMNGFFTCNGYADAVAVHSWFDNAGAVSGHGQVVVPKLQFNDSLQNRVIAAQQVSDYTVGSDVEVFVSAYDLDELKTLSEITGVGGVYLTTERLEAVTFTLAEAVDLSGKKLMLDSKVNLALGTGATLTVDALEDLYYNGRWCRIEANAGGGTLTIGVTPVISGDAAADAVFTVTEGMIFTSGGQWQWRYPITENQDKWYYIQTGAAVSAKGNLEPVGLDVEVDGVLNVVDTFAAGYVEVRNEINVVEPNGYADIRCIDYCANSVERALRGTERTNFELEFDLNTGSGYDDIYDHLGLSGPDADKVYLQADGNDVPVAPSRSGYTFGGWKADSSWTSPTAEQLAAFTVKRAEGDESETGWYVGWPTEFPVRMVAQWTAAGGYDGGGSGSTGGSKTETTTNPDGSKTEVTTAADGSTGEVKTAADGTVTEASATVSDQAVKAGAEEGKPVTLTVELPVAETAEEAAPLTIELPAEAGAVMVEIPVTDVTASSVVVLVHEDGTEEILPRTGKTENSLTVKVEGKVTVKIVDNEKSFNDMPADPEQAEAIRFVAARGMMNGVGEGNFAPTEPMSRAMIATLLYRMERKPETDGATGFTDVPENQWYSEAIAWAAEEGIVTGYGDAFGVDDSVTNEQLIVMMWRLAGKPEAPAIESGASSWAVDAISWAIEVGLIDRSQTGESAGAEATRGEVSTLIMRFINL